MIEKQSVPEKTINNVTLVANNFGNPTDIMDLPADIDPEAGQIDFVKRSSGDTIIIKFGGDQPKMANATTPGDYDVILTDVSPTYTRIFGISPGKIRALGFGGGAGGSVLSTFAAYNRCPAV